MAEGFLWLPTQNQCPEDVGNEYFMSLLSRSFFQDVEYDDWGNVISCKIHDLMHDLAVSVAGTECTMSKLDARNVDGRTHHVSFVSDLDLSGKFPTAFLRARNLRTCLWQKTYSRRLLSESNLRKIFMSFKRLRTLDLSRSDIQIVPSSIGKLKHLRHLNLSHNSFRKLPNSMSRLLNLQVLDLTSCSYLDELHRDIREMVSLEHLLNEGCGSLTMQEGLGLLTSLLTLRLYVVCKRNELSKLSELNNLRGSLTIKKLGQMENSNSRFANLAAKEYLQSLKLRWDTKKTDIEINEDLLEGLKPHQNLKQLSIKKFRGVRLSSWLSSLTNLRVIVISSCKRLQCIPQLDQLTSLKSLTLSSLPALEYISLINLF